MKYLLIFLLCINIAFAGKHTFKSHGIEVTLYSAVAGGICSIKWNNQEYIDCLDNGRGLQSASTFDGKEEDWNPTEQGANYAVDGYNYKDRRTGDLKGRTSSIILPGYILGDNNTYTKTQMAFWNPVNKVKTSNHILEKWVTIGTLGMNNVIQYDVLFHIPRREYHKSGKFEFLTGYMPKEFVKHYVFDNGRLRLLPYDKPAGEQKYPLIFATRNGSHAIGIISHKTNRRGGYGTWRFPQNKSIVKWNVVDRIDNPRGPYFYRTYLAIGSLYQVQESMIKISQRVER